jgi:hypothetical protein
MYEILHSLKLWKERMGDDESESGVRGRMKQET